MHKIALLLGSDKQVKIDLLDDLPKMESTHGSIYFNNAVATGRCYEKIAFIYVENSLDAR